jgi:hypothetical protein
VVYHLIAMKHPFRDEYEPSSHSATQDSRSRTVKTNQNGGGTKGKGKGKGQGRGREPESEESINQFPTQQSQSQTQTQQSQSQTQTQQEELGATKRKFMEMDIDDEDEDDEERYSTQNGSKGWAEYRKIHGEGTVGAGESKEVRHARNVLEEVKLFVVSHPEPFKPVRGDRWFHPLGPG